jgi:DNA-binding NarL/FixJ family response regulator
MLKVFLVDGSPLVRRRLATLLGALADVTIVGEAEEPDAALRGIRATGANLAIVDLHLTGSNGMTVVKSLASGTPRVFTMVLTNHSSPAFRTACHDAGADYFFDKTCEHELARDTVGRLAKETHCAVDVT